MWDAGALDQICKPIKLELEEQRRLRIWLHTDWFQRNIMSHLRRETLRYARRGKLRQPSADLGKLYAQVTSINPKP